jgi:hypothetical protein
MDVKELLTRIVRWGVFCLLIVVIVTVAVADAV